jgi:hypothetical protein
MNGKFSLFSGLILFVLVSCDIVNTSIITVNDYENASLHMGRNFNKHLDNIITYQKWDNEESFHYKLKLKEKTESFTIDLKSLKKITYLEKKVVESQKKT